MQSFFSFSKSDLLAVENQNLSLPLIFYRLRKEYLGYHDWIYANFA